MSSSIHYKVKTGNTTSPNWSSIHFDGIHLTCFELKRRIIYAEGWMRSEADAGTFDLLITNSQNAEDYKDDGYSIHRNVSVIAKKIPALNPSQARKLYIPPGSLGPDWNKSTSTWVPPGMIADQKENPNNTALGRPPAIVGEEDGVAAAMQAAGKYTSAPRQRSGPFVPAPQRGALTATSKPPGGYVCHRCKQGGHYIQFCPTNGDSAYDLGRRGATTREDRERERQAEREKERERYLPDRGAAVNDKNSVWLKPIEDPKALTEGSSQPSDQPPVKGPAKFVYSSGFFSSTTTGAGQVPYVAPITSSSSSKSNVPSASQLSYQYSDPSSIDPSQLTPSGDLRTHPQRSELSVTLRPDLACKLCKDYFVDAHVIGCCYNTFCNECIREHFQHTPSCPSCNSTDVTVDDLQPNVNLQKAVDTFLAEHPDIERGAVKRARQQEQLISQQLQPPTNLQSQLDSVAQPPATAVPTPALAEPVQAYNPPDVTVKSESYQPQTNMPYPPPNASHFPPPPPLPSSSAQSSMPDHSSSSSSSSSSSTTHRRDEDRSSTQPSQVPSQPQPQLHQPPQMPPHMFNGYPPNMMHPPPYGMPMNGYPMPMPMHGYAPMGMPYQPYGGNVAGYTQYPPPPQVSSHHHQSDSHKRSSHSEDRHGDHKRTRRS